MGGPWLKTWQDSMSGLWLNFRKPSHKDQKCFRNFVHLRDFVFFDLDLDFFDLDFLDFERLPPCCPCCTCCTWAFGAVVALVAVGAVATGLEGALTAMRLADDAPLALDTPMEFARGFFFGPENQLKRPISILGL